LKSKNTGAMSGTGVSLIFLKNSDSASLLVSIGVNLFFAIF
jgi:energy-converting hydrogenase Eha subunit E